MKFILLAAVIATTVNLTAATPALIPMASKSQVDAKLLAQQRYTADVAAAAFVAMQEMVDAALTNQLMAGAVLMAYTNSLDNSDGAAFLQAVDRYQQATLATLNTFLGVQAALNDDLRVQVAADANAAAQLGASDSVALYAPGLVTEDQVADELLVANQAHYAWRPTAEHPVLRIAEPDPAAAVATRFTASIAAYLTNNVSFFSPSNTAYMIVGPTNFSGWVTFDIDQYSSSLYVLRVTDLEVP